MKRRVDTTANYGAASAATDLALVVLAQYPRCPRCGEPLVALDYPGGYPGRPLWACSDTLCEESVVHFGSATEPLKPSEAGREVVGAVQRLAAWLGGAIG